MGGFAGIVNYSANFLYEINSVTNHLWNMAGGLGAGCQFGIDVLEDTGAFVKNACLPIRSGDYCAKRDGRVYYLFYQGKAKPSRIVRLLTQEGPTALSGLERPYCGAFYMVNEKRLLLFRSADGAELFYRLGHGGELVFGTDRRALQPASAGQVALEGNMCAVYDAMGFRKMQVKQAAAGQP